MATTNPSILLYNPRVAQEGYHRLPLSLLQAGIFLEGRHDYEIIDGNLDQHIDKSEVILRRLDETGAKYLGITIMPGPQLQSALPHINRIKAARPDITIIVGGYFPSLNSEICARHAAIDYVIDGPGEDTLPELLDALESGGDPSQITGLVFLREGRVVRTGKRAPRDPNTLPWFPYDRVDVTRYISATHLGARTLSHHSSYGCPFTCNFCGVTGVAEGRWMPEDAVRLADITEHMVKTWNIDALEFHDNNFFTQQKRVLAYSQELIRRNINIAWWGEGRIDTLLKYTPESWAAMRDSGLKMIFMGMEASNPETLKRMNKGGTLKARDSVVLAELMASFGIVPEYSFILGNPPEPRKDIEETFQLIRAIKEANPKSEIIMYRYDPVPLPGAMMEQAEQSGFALPTDLNDWMDPKNAKIHLRRTADLPWLTREDMRYIRNFETVLNARYPTSTSRRLHTPLTRLALRATSGLRFRLGLYDHPYELRLLQKLIRYQRPETSGF